MGMTSGRRRCVLAMFPFRMLLSCKHQMIGPLFTAVLLPTLRKSARDSPSQTSKELRRGPRWAQYTKGLLKISLCWDVG